MDYKDKGVPDKTDELGLPEALDKKARRPRLSLWKWLIFAFFILYFVVTAYRLPLLIKLGEYLVVEHEGKGADLIVCIAGNNLERAPGAAAVYEKGLAPYIFRAKELTPDGFDYVKKKIGDYPAEFDLFTQIIRGFGIAPEVILSPDDRVGSTIEEARLVRDQALAKGFKSLILVTSPIQSRRTWLTFKKVFKKDNITILSLPSHYQAFNPKDWWKNREYAKEVIFEYQKLIYYKLAYGI